MIRKIFILLVVAGFLGLLAYRLFQQLVPDKPGLSRPVLVGKAHPREARGREAVTVLRRPSALPVLPSAAAWVEVFRPF